MRRRHITIATHSGPPRTKRFVIGSLGIVLTVTATSGMAMAGRSTHGAKSESSASSFHAHHDDQSDQLPQTSGAVNGDATNTNTSSTTVSINGETIRVNGDGTYNRVYDSADGASNVNVSVHNLSSNTSSGSSTSSNSESSGEAGMD